MRRTAGLVLVLAGAFFLAVSLVGDRTDAGRYVNLPPRSWERFDPTLASGTPDLESLYRAARARASRNLREMPPQETMDILYGVVSDRFTHGDRATYNLYSNWILWAVGTVSPRHRYMQDADALLRNGHSAMCGETSYILLRLAGMAGIPSRHVHLNGHIVMEARYSDRWHAYDPGFRGARPGRERQYPERGGSRRPAGPPPTGLLGPRSLHSNGIGPDDLYEHRRRHVRILPPEEFLQSGRPLARTGRTGGKDRKVPRTGGPDGIGFPAGSSRAKQEKATEAMTGLVITRRLIP